MKISKTIQSLIEIILGLVCAFIVIIVFFKEKKDFGDAALGEETISVNAHDSVGNLIHTIKLTKAEFDSVILGWNVRGKKDVILCLGNSQTHGINQFKQGDVNYPRILFDEFKKKSLDVLTTSMPNANLQEHLLLFDFWTKYLPVKYLVIPVFMDDMREDGIRYFEELDQEHFKIQNDTSVICSLINKEVSEWHNKESTNDISALNKTVQEKSELYLNSWLDKRFKPWTMRADVRGTLFLDLYLIRNTLFGITAGTKRKMIAANYKNNIEALIEIISGAELNNIKVLVYIPPIRSDIEIPYDKIEYLEFKNQVINIVAKGKGNRFINLDTIVPGKYWGMKNSTNINGKPEYDFMHFQYFGHKELARYLIPEINKMIYR